MRSRVLGAALFALATAAPSFAEEKAAANAGPAATAASFAGELAFSEEMAFDYDRDGTPDRVQFWIQLEGRPATGLPGDPGESGSVRYFVVDLKQKRRIDNWLVGLNMSEGFPVAGEAYPLTNISVTGKTARFDLKGSTWTVTDKGKGWKKDSIEIATGGRVRPGRFYGGDIRVTPGLSVAAGAKGAGTAAPAAPPPFQVGGPAADSSSPVSPLVGNAAGQGFAKPAPLPEVVAPPADVPANRRCIKCHDVAAGNVAAVGGPHSDLKCVSCHNKHPKEIKDAKPQCLNCHNSHSESITMSQCSTCHSSHDVHSIRYGIQIPDAHCASCHKKSTATLQASGTRHTGLACVVCHRHEHTRVPSCVACHSGPHARRVMSKPEGCVRCHTGAHETTIDR